MENNDDKSSNIWLRIVGTEGTKKPNVGQSPLAVVKNPKDKYTRMGHPSIGC